MERTLKRGSIGKEVIHGVTGHQLARHIRSAPHDFATQDSGEIITNQISEHLVGALAKHQVFPADLHTGNYLLSHGLNDRLTSFILGSPKEAQAISKGKQSQFEQFFQSFLKPKDRISIVDSVSLHSPRDLEAMVGLSGAFPHGTIGGKTTSGDFNRFAGGFVPNFLPTNLLSEFRRLKGRVDNREFQMRPMSSLGEYDKITGAN